MSSELEPAGANRDEIRREVLLQSAIHDELEKAAELKKGAWAALNSPFFVTLVGGALIAVLSALWQSASADHQQRNTLLENSYKRKSEVLTLFAKEVQCNVTFFSQYVKHPQIWLNSRKELPPEQRDRYMGLYTFDQTLKQFEADRRSFYKTAPIEGDLALVRGTYETAEVKSAIEDLAKRWKTLESDAVSDETMFDSGSGEFLSKFRDALDRMARELESDQRRLEGSVTTFNLWWLGIACAGAAGLLLVVFKVKAVVKAFPRRKPQRTSDDPSALI